jgi:hypothetical protein
MDANVLRKSCPPDSANVGVEHPREEQRRPVRRRPEHVKTCAFPQRFHCSAVDRNPLDRGRVGPEPPVVQETTVGGPRRRPSTYDLPQPPAIGANGPQRRRAGVRSDEGDLISTWRPDRHANADGGIVLKRDGARTGTVGSSDPEIRVPARIRHEDDLPIVGTD